MSAYIAPAHKALRHVDRLAAWQRGETPAPVTVEWDLSNICSLGCLGCVGHFAHTHEAGPWANAAPRPDSYTSTGRFASPALVQRALGEMATSGVKAIVWSGGGEPTLHPEFADITSLAAGHGFEQGLYTHGGHVTDAMAADLASSLSWAVVSLDACTPETYAAEKRVPVSRFHAACDGVRRLSSAGIVTGVSFLLHAGNWRDAVSMLRLSRELGATYTTFRPTIQTDIANPSVATADRSWIDEAVVMLGYLERNDPDVEVSTARFKAYRDWRGHGYTACHGTRLNATITPDGRVWVCPQRRGLAGSEIGDMRRESFGALWARHPGAFTVDASCRVMCRLHPVNLAVAPVFEAHLHEAFV